MVKRTKPEGYISHMVDINDPRCCQGSINDFCTVLTCGTVTFSVFLLDSSSCLNIEMNTEG